MNDTTTLDAVGRIEAALVRLEAAIRNTSDLAERHQTLKQAVARSIAELDGLLTQAEAGGSER
ncbi:hypothetical protein WSK_0900 [Novosphingobium sp. Rr 2-17]|uniref:hypothetical protein n=1 Tax=Novosphingobium sp. Rr 2-17 TaxID=555793 RepID=UPI0002698E98|nr:hypothetical protein [Novosphingobium sp. Rr 2-17]EIZ80620.1 hypothetical protein WSK_0900 [Novosphingobium sp. Rr 2-17]